MLKDKKTRITFHNGLRTIGGTIIEIIYEDSHLFFDFGSEYNPKAVVQPKNLQELLDENLVPFVDNVFDPSIELKGFESKENVYKNTAVFLSHVHLDHSKIINYLDPKIPLYTLEGTKSLLNTLNINNDFLFPIHNNTTGKNTREIIGVKENEIVKVGKIEVKIMPIDHDAYGACALFIKTPDTTIAYTGDLRLHGYRKQDTLNFCKESHNCDVLIIEGVSVSFREIEDEMSPDEIASESELIERINKVIDSNNGKQITFNYYISNIERIMNIIKTCSRKVVLNSYYSYVVKEATGYETLYYSLDGKEYDLDKSKKVDFETLLNDESEYMFQLDYLDRDNVSKLKKGGVYIHSNAMPIVEADPAYAPFMELFEKAGITVYKISCSGHAHPKDLISIINLVQPKLLVPIHSYRPEKLYNESGDRLLPTKRQTI